MIPTYSRSRSPFLFTAGMPALKIDRCSLILVLKQGVDISSVIAALISISRSHHRFNGLPLRLEERERERGENIHGKS